MSISAAKRAHALATDVRFEKDRMRVVFQDGRKLLVPLEWFPRLAKATGAARRRWRIVGGGVGIHWESLDEDISVRGLPA